MTEAINTAQVASDIDAMRINMLLSKHREPDIFSELANLPVRHRAKAYKYWAYVGYLVAKGRALDINPVIPGSEPVANDTEFTPTDNTIEKPKTAPIQKVAKQSRGGTDFNYENLDDIPDISSLDF